MKIASLSIEPYEIGMITGSIRSGVYLDIDAGDGRRGRGEVAPLPNWSKETLQQSLQQLQEKKSLILAVDWTIDNCLENLRTLNLYPSLAFGLESALLSILSPLPEEEERATSALLMGSPAEILRLADLREGEGFSSAKLKVGHLPFETAFDLIGRLKSRFSLRIDVNRAWETEESLAFFKQFPIDSFDYVEEPFKDPHALAEFEHPLAIDESYPTDLSLDFIEHLPTVKALIYKPTMQGGWLHLEPLKRWADARGISIVLSSSFESRVGLSHIASLAQRLSLKAPMGLGTLPYMIDP